jgi:hypothetical protein
MYFINFHDKDEKSIKITEEQFKAIDKNDVLNNNKFIEINGNLYSVSSIRNIKKDESIEVDIY